MANLPPVPVMGSEGPPPIKKPRTDSDSGEFGRVKKGGLAEKWTYFGETIIVS